MFAAQLFCGACFCAYTLGSFFAVVLSCPV